MLNGEADSFGEKDGTATLNELLGHIDQAVRRETGSVQHFQKAGRFDRNMVIGRGQ